MIPFEFSTGDRYISRNIYIYITRNSCVLLLFIVMVNSIIEKVPVKAKLTFIISLLYPFVTFHILGKLSFRVYFVKIIYINIDLTHASNDAVDRELRRTVQNGTVSMILPVMRFLSDSKCRVFLLSDVDVVAGVSSSH